MSDLHGKFVWYELLTTDTDAAAKFYGKVIGWETSPMAMEGGVTYTIFNVPGTEHGVGGMMPIPAELKAAGMPPNWTGYVYVDDVDATAAQFAELGGCVQRAPADIPTIGRFAVVADPQGAVIIIFKPLPRDDVPPPLDPFTPGLNGWNELYAADWSSAFDFYAKVFGWTKDQEMDMGPMGTYLTFSHNGQMTGGMMTKTPNIPEPCWGYYFIVTDIDAGMERIKSAGGMVINGPMEVPGNAFVCQCTDPQGAFFSIVGSRS